MSGRGIFQRLADSLGRNKSEDVASPGDSTVRWYPPGSTCEVAGLQIRSGMVYVGRAFGSIGPLGPSIEPALVDPNLPVSFPRMGASTPELPYWPSYSEIESLSRGRYLEWLAGGRAELRIPIGYVFLFLYGLERRLLYDDAAHDAVAAAERELLLDEIERLLRTYGDHASFQRYATQLRDVVRIRSGTIGRFPLPQFPPEPSYETPLYLQARLGRYIALGEPIPGEWALAWVAASPEARLRTVARRCPALFREQFLRRYAERFTEDGGLIVRAEHAPLTITVQPASASFRGASVTLEAKELRHLGGLNTQKQPLYELLESVSEELAPYSRSLSSKSAFPKLASLALLPSETGRFESCDEREAVRSWIRAQLGDRMLAVVAAADLRSFWTPLAPPRWGAKDDGLLIRLLAQDGIGIEPDVRFEAESLADVEKAVLFRFHQGEEPKPLPVFRLAALLLHLGALVANVEGEVSAVEEVELANRLESSLHLGRPERVRLEARMRQLLADPPRGTGGLKKRLAIIDSGSRAKLASLLIPIAGADGRISTPELKMLRKIFDLLGQPRETLDREIQALGGLGDGGREPAAGGVDASSRPEPTVLLDPDRIAVRLAETARASALLASVFRDEVDADIDQVLEREEEPEMIDPDAVLGLDSAHSALLLYLGQRESWNRGELERVARTLGILLDGALETINTAVVTRCGTLLAEGDDPIEIDLETARELQGADLRT